QADDFAGLRPFLLVQLRDRARLHLRLLALIRGNDMLPREINDLLTRVGPDTPGGELMRRYWQPAALSEELPPDGPPLVVRLMGEDLVLVRGGDGQPG